MFFDKRFAEIGAEMIRMAERVPCTMEEFVSGMQDIADTLNERISISVEEIKFLQKDD